MLRIVPNFFSMFVIRIGNQLFTKNGEAIATLLRCRSNFFSHLQEDVEVEMRVRPVDRKEKLEEEIAQNLEFSKEHEILQVLKEQQPQFDNQYLIKVGIL